MRSPPTAFTCTILLALALAALSAGLAAATTASAAAAANAAPSTAPPAEAQALRALQAAEEDKLSTSWGAACDRFGCAVAISGNTAVVGAVGDSLGGNSDQGSAYVFTRSGGVWDQQQKLTAPDGTAGDYFGIAVAIFGNTVVVGAGMGLSSDQGSICVFTRSGSMWRMQKKLTAADGADIDRNENQGSTYIYRIAKPAMTRAKSHQGWTGSRKPTLRWARATGASAYEVRIYKGSKLLKKRTGITKTAWKCTKRLPRKVSLKWKVRARNVAGNGAWSSALRFKVR